MRCAVKEFPLAGLKLITPKKFGDNRGFFSETYNAEMLAELGIQDRFVQDNHLYRSRRARFGGCITRTRHMHRPSWCV
jgi:dTDP-4-dehydrorhamnose 3,5-epimerase-like enzyme